MSELMDRTELREVRVIGQDEDAPQGGILRHVVRVDTETGLQDPASAETVHIPQDINLGEE